MSSTCKIKFRPALVLTVSVILLFTFSSRAQIAGVVKAAEAVVEVIEGSSAIWEAPVILSESRIAVPGVLQLSDFAGVSTLHNFGGRSSKAAFADYLANQLKNPSPEFSKRVDEKFGKMFSANLFPSTTRITGTRIELLGSKLPRLDNGTPSPLTILTDSAATATEATRVLAERVPFATVALRISSDPLRGLQKLDSKPHKLTLLLNIPDSNAAASKIHQGQIIPFAVDDGWGPLRSSLDLYTQAASISNVQVKIVTLWNSNDNNTAHDRINRVLMQQGDGDLCVIFTHVWNKTIWFHDGSSMPVREFAGKGCAWVVGCSTLDSVSTTPGLGFGTTGALDYLQALQAAHATAQLFDQGASFRRIMRVLTIYGLILVQDTNGREHSNVV